MYRAEFVCNIPRQDASPERFRKLFPLAVQNTLHPRFFFKIQHTWERRGDNWIGPAFAPPSCHAPPDGCVGVYYLEPARQEPFFGISPIQAMAEAITVLDRLEAAMQHSFYIGTMPPFDDSPWSIVNTWRFLQVARGYGFAAAEVFQGGKDSSMVDGHPWEVYSRNFPSKLLGPPAGRRPETIMFPDEFRTWGPVNPSPLMREVLEELAVEEFDKIEDLSGLPERWGLNDDSDQLDELDHLIGLAMRDPDPEPDLTNLPELTAEDRAAMDSLGPDFVKRLLKEHPRAAIASPVKETEKP